MRKLILAAFAVTALAMTWPATAQVPQPYPPSACTVGTSGSLLTPGEPFTVIVDCPGLSGEVTVTVPGVGNVALSSTGKAGQYSGSLFVPESARAGFMTLTARAAGKVIGMTRANVVAPLSSKTGVDEKASGSASNSVAPWALAGAATGGGLLVLGLAVIGVWLKSRRSVI